MTSVVELGIFVKPARSTVKYERNYTDLVAIIIPAFERMHFKTTMETISRSSSSMTTPQSEDIHEANYVTQHLPELYVVLHQDDLNSDQKHCQPVIIDTVTICLVLRDQQYLCYC